MGCFEGAGRGLWACMRGRDCERLSVDVARFLLLLWAATISEKSVVVAKDHIVVLRVLQ